jgi:hypothetical protein
MCEQVREQMLKMKPQTAETGKQGTCTVCTLCSMYSMYSVCCLDINSSILSDRDVSLDSKLLSIEAKVFDERRIENVTAGLQCNTLEQAY